MDARPGASRNHGMRAAGEAGPHRTDGAGDVPVLHGDALMSRALTEASPVRVDIARDEHEANGYRATLTMSDGTDHVTWGDTPQQAILMAADIAYLMSGDCPGGRTPSGHKRAHCLCRVISREGGGVGDECCLCGTWLAR